MLDKIKIIKDQRTELKQRNTETVRSDKPIDPRPLPSPHNRHLDVDRVLARSLPRVSGEADSSPK